MIMVKQRVIKSFSLKENNKENICLPPIEERAHIALGPVTADSFHLRMLNSAQSVCRCVYHQSSVSSVMLRVS